LSERPKGRKYQEQSWNPLRRGELKKERAGSKRLDVGNECRLLSALRVTTHSDHWKIRTRKKRAAGCGMVGGGLTIKVVTPFNGSVG